MQKGRSVRRLSFGGEGETKGLWVRLAPGPSAAHVMPLARSRPVLQDQLALAAASPLLTADVLHSQLAQPLADA